MKGSAFAVASVAITWPMIIPSSVFGADAPSNRTTMGCIGVGSKGASNMKGFRAKPDCELVRNGRIGRLQTVRVSIPGNNRTCDPTWTPEPVPEALDYGLWLGPAPLEPYHKQRCHYQFRFVSDYSAGQMTNWGAHHLDIRPKIEMGPAERTLH